MRKRILQTALTTVFVCMVGIHPTAAQIIPNPAYPTPTPTPNIWSIIDPPVSTPTVPPVNPPPVSTPTVPPITPPPPATPSPTIPAISIPNPLGKADPQVAQATVYYGQNGVLGLLNDRGRFQKVALLANQVVTLVVTLSPVDYGKPATIQLLDGGAMTTAVSAPKAKDIIPPTPTPYPSPTINALPISSGPGPSPTPMPAVTPPPTDLPDPSTLLDTGALMTVSQAGELIFGFKPGADAGLHRISVIVGGNQYFLQFWRQNAGSPNSNPRMRHAY